MDIITESFKIADDDGLLLIASRKKLLQRYAAQPFNYDFPEALLEGMNAGELVAWMTETEGTFSIVINIGDVFDYSAMEKAGWQAMKNYRLFIEDDDELLVLPYSQYSFTCAQNQGQVEMFEGLNRAMPISKGWYRVDIVGALHSSPLEDEEEDEEDEDDADDVNGEFIIFLTPDAPIPDKRIYTDVPRF
jgi:hypothetical protein